MINYRDIISNINNIDFQLGPLPPSFRKFNATDTKTPKGPSNNENIEYPSRKKARKTKRLKNKINPHLLNENSETQKN